MKRVLLKAYYKKNLGDDLFVKIISDSFPEVQFLADGREEYTNISGNVKRIGYRSNINRVIQAVKRRLKSQQLVEVWSALEGIVNNILYHDTVATVYISGSIFMDKFSRDKSKLIEKEQAFSIISKNVISVKSDIKRKKIFFIGQNVGPIYTEEYLLEVANTFTRAADVCLRDKFSYNLFEKYENVRYAPDVIFNLKIMKKEDDNSIVFSIIEPSKNAEHSNANQAYYKKMAEMIEEFQSGGFKIVLVSFCKWEGDERAIEEILKIVTYSEKVETLYYDGDIEAILDCFQKACYIVGARFHSIILSLLLGIPFLPVVYGQKTENYLNDIGFTGKILHVNNLDSIELEDYFYNYNQNIVMDISQHVQEASRQFDGFRRFLDDFQDGK